MAAPSGLLHTHRRKADIAGTFSHFFDKRQARRDGRTEGRPLRLRPKAVTVPGKVLVHPAASGMPDTLEGANAALSFNRTPATIHRYGFKWPLEMMCQRVEGWHSCLFFSFFFGGVRSILNHLSDTLRLLAKRPIRRHNAPEEYTVILVCYNIVFWKA